jgi:hypothetical protein
MLQNASWKTTLAGLLTAIGVFMSTQLEDPTLKGIGGIIAAIGAFLTGLLARDNKRTSEQVNAG